MAIEYQLILIGAVGGLVRDIIGYIKARMKHGEKFSPAKFIMAITWGSGMGIALTYLEQGYALTFATPAAVMIAIGGVVVIDELLQAAFKRDRREGDI